MRKRGGYKRKLKTTQGKGLALPYASENNFFFDSESAHEKQDEKPYACSHCDVTLKSSQALKRHTVIHTGNKTYFSCLKCEKSFKRDHMKKHYTLTNENEGIPCKKCNKTFLNVPKLNQHIRNVHSEKTCLPCDEPFSSAANLNSRQIMHFNETPFACAICEKTFKRKQHLTNHQDIHNVGKQYPCPKCGGSFKSQKNLRSHQKTHRIRVKTFQCKHCEKKFMTSTQLVVHERLHTQGRHQ